MAKKTLLNEAQVRRFMGLAGMQPVTVSNVIQEMGMSYEADEDPADAEAPAMDAAPPSPEPEEMEMDADEEGEMGDEDREVSIDEEDIEALEMVLAKLKGEAPEDEPEALDEPEDMGAPEPMDEPEDMDDELSEVNLQLSEEEIVQEVARRVAKRIIKAKRAKKVLDEALGKK